MLAHDRHDQPARLADQRGAAVRGLRLGLGSRTLIKDLLIGVVLSVTSWYAFYVGLGIPLSAGLLDGVL